MNNLLKRSLAILLLLCMLLPTLAACNGDGGDTDTDTDTDVSNDTEEQVDIPENLRLATYGGFALKGDKLSMNLTSDEPTVDLAKRFSGGDGTRISLTIDEKGEIELPDTKLSLSEGENVFYVKVGYRKESYVYPATINYHFARTVKFYTNCEQFIEPQRVDDGEKAVEPAAPTREGYSFLGWYLDGKKYDFSTVLTDNCTLIAHWDKNDKKNGYYASETLGTGLVEFKGISAGLHIVWKDYADMNGLRPDEVTCVLTQTCGKTENKYEIILKKDSVAWKDSSNTPSSYELRQGDGGAWTLYLGNLPEKADGKKCEYSLTQKEANKNYTTRQNGSTVTNFVNGYVHAVDDTVKLTTSNSRLYDEAGNLITLTGVVSGNVGWQATLNTTTPKALAELSEMGCNVLRVTVPIVAIKSLGHAYVYWAKDGNYRTGEYNKVDDAHLLVDNTAKNKVINTASEMIDRATAAGMYVIINWPILTSNPNQYTEEASDFFGKMSKKYADNPYVMWEICNEPASCAWSGDDGIKAYAEKLIDVIRGNDSDAVIIVAPRAAANYVSMSPVAYDQPGDAAGDDPIFDPLDDDRRYNVAYTHHPYPYENPYNDANDRSCIGWRLRDAYEAGLTIICTEMSPIAAKLDEADSIGYDFEQMNIYMRMFQEYDMSWCYFKYINSTAYDEWKLLMPNFNPDTDEWSRDSFTKCGQYYYDLMMGDGVFVTPNYNATSVKAIRDSYAKTFSAYGLSATSGKSFFTPFPTFAVKAEKQDAGYFFRTDFYDILTDEQYATYCQRMWKKISSICGGTAKQANGAAFTDASVPKTKDEAMELTYTYNGKTCSLKISYVLNQADQSFGILFSVK